MLGRALSEIEHHTLRRLKQRIEEQFDKGFPYVTISLKQIQREFDIKSRGGINFITKELKKEYRVGKDKDWLIIEEQ